MEKAYNKIKNDGGDYDRSEKKYEAYRFDDVNTWCYISGNKEVYTEFTF